MYSTGMKSLSVKSFLFSKDNSCNCLPKLKLTSRPRNKWKYLEHNIAFRVRELVSN